MADLKRLYEMLGEITSIAESKGFDVTLETPEDASSKEEAYVLGRYEQLVSVLDETDGSDVDDLF